MRSGRAMRPSRTRPWYKLIHLFKPDPNAPHSTQQNTNRNFNAGQPKTHEKITHVQTTHQYDRSD